MLEASQVPEAGRSIASVTKSNHQTTPTSSRSPVAMTQFDFLRPLRHRLEQLEVRNIKTARRIAKLIPAQCPFERDIKLLGHTVAHIPPLCKLNPLYEQLLVLRFRALCYLADECGEDIRSYC